MRKLALTAALGAACLSLAACGEREATNASTDSGSAAPSAEGNGTSTTTTTAVAFPKGARIVEEDGVTFRIDPDGTRVRLEANDSRIVVEDGVRYRVDPDGTRVRIGDDGLAIDLPDVDVGINKKGNLDVDVGDKDPDGGR